MKLPVENKFFYLCWHKIFSEFLNICPSGGRCIWEKHYIGIASSLQTSAFVKCFIHKISFSNREVMYKLIAKTRLFLFWLLEYSFDCYSLLFFWILTFLSQNNFNTQTYEFAIIMEQQKNRPFYIGRVSSICSAMIEKYLIR